MKDKLQQRVLQLQAAIEQSAANHNALLGRLSESKEILEEIEKEEGEYPIEIAVSE